jgi:transposase-like protein
MNSLLDLPSNWQCHKQLFKIVWGTETCPDCNGKLRFKPSYEWCKVCRRKTSVKSETNFRHSNLSYRQLYALIWCWQHKQSIGSTRQIVQLSYPTVSKWFDKLRQLLPDTPGKLSGVIEIDESFFGRMKFTKSGGYKLVVGAIERGSRHIRLRIVSDRNRETLEQFILDSIEAGSHINTDAWRAYNELRLLGYTHDWCNHSLGHFGPTNHIENLWSVMKRHIRSTYGKLSRINLPLILKEWETRQNQPDLMYNVSNYLRATVCSGLFE